MPALLEVTEVAQRFQRKLDFYNRSAYKEARLRVEFIDAFFEVTNPWACLGSILC